MHLDRQDTIARLALRSRLVRSSCDRRFLKFLVNFVTYAFDEMPRPFFLSLGVPSFSLLCATAFLDATINWFTQSSCVPIRMKLQVAALSTYCGHIGMHTPSTNMLCINPSAPAAASKFLFPIFGFFGAVAPAAPDDFLF